MGTFRCSSNQTTQTQPVRARPILSVLSQPLSAAPKKARPHILTRATFSELLQEYNYMAAKEDYNKGRTGLNEIVSHGTSVLTLKANNRAHIQYVQQSAA